MDYLGSYVLLLKLNLSISFSPLVMFFPTHFFFKTSFHNHLLTAMRSLLLVVTRVHMQVSSTKPDVIKMVEFVKKASTYADNILICHDVQPLMEEYLEELKSVLNELGFVDKVYFLSVNPWGYFTHPLNAALQFAQERFFPLVAFQSVEYAITNDRVYTLVEMITSATNVLVVGPEMDGHCFSESEGDVPLRGRTCPWNTFAVWNVAKLCVTGFPMIGDGVAGNRQIGGVEEVSAISMLQLISPTQHKAYLVRFCEHYVPPDSSSHWSTSFSLDAARQAYHDKKMASKDDRPAEQLKIAGIPEGVVTHIKIAL